MRVASRGARAGAWEEQKERARRRGGQQWIDSAHSGRDGRSASLSLAALMHSMIEFLTPSQMKSSELHGVKPQLRNLPASQGGRAPIRCEPVTNAPIRLRLLLARESAYLLKNCAGCSRCSHFH
jgi:hypothetical protein